MARNQVIVSCAANDWTQLTNGDITAAGFQVRTGSAEVRYTADTTKPALTDKGRVFGPGEGMAVTAIATLTALSGAVRIWAKPLGVDAEVFIDHA